MQLLYNSDLVGAALGFVNELQHHSSRVLERTSNAGDEHGQPRNLTERVLHSFARHDTPVDRPVSLPLVSVDMYCPGTVYSWLICSVQVDSAFYQRAQGPVINMYCPNRLCLWIDMSCWCDSCCWLACAAQVHSVRFEQVTSISSTQHSFALLVQCHTQQSLCTV